MKIAYQRTFLAIIFAGLISLSVGSAWAEDGYVPGMDLIDELEQEVEEKSFFFTVGDGREDYEWSAGVCDEVNAMWAALCLSLGHDDVDSDLRIAEARRSGIYRYYAHMERDAQGGLVLDIRDWSERALDRRILDFASSSEEGAEADWALEFMNQNTLVGPLGLETSPNLEPNRLRTTLLLSKSMAWAMWWYLASGDLNSTDWDYAGLYSDDPDLTPQSQKWRGFDGWRFDDNVMYFNTPMHPMAGAGYHILARSNNLGIWSSILASHLTSFFWEAAIEHHEVVSINDMILTGVGGIAMGEAYIQLGNFFRRAERTRLNQILSWIFGAPSQFNDLADGTGPLHMGERNEFGWPADIWHRFVIQPGFGASSIVDGESTRMDGDLSLSSELVRLPDFRREGSHQRWMAGPLATEADFRIAAGQEGFYGWELSGDMNFAGFYKQEINAGKGYSAWIGTGLGFRHISHQFDTTRDRFGLVNFPGLTLDGSWLTGPAKLRLRYRLHPDFSSINSFALPDYVEESGQVPGRTLLEDFGYYFGWGLSSLLSLEADLSPVHLHWDWNLHYARSINALDRFRDDETRFGEDLDGYLSLTDIAGHHKVGAMVELPINYMRVGAVGEYRSRRGELQVDNEDWAHEMDEWRGMGVIQLVY